MVFATSIAFAFSQNYPPETRAAAFIPESAASACALQPESSKIKRILNSGLECAQTALAVAWLGRMQSYWNKSYSDWKQTDWVPISPPPGALPAVTFLTPRFNGTDQLEVCRPDVKAPVLLISTLEPVPGTEIVGYRERQVVYRFDPATGAFSEEARQDWSEIHTNIVLCNSSLKNWGELRIGPAHITARGADGWASRDQLFFGDRAVQTSGTVVVLMQPISDGKQAVVVSASGYRPAGGHFGFLSNPEQFGDPYHLQIFDAASGEPASPSQEIPLPRGIRELRSCLVLNDKLLVLVTESPCAICFVTLASDFVQP